MRTLLHIMAGLIALALSFLIAFIFVVTMVVYVLAGG